jgi:hypothetical protein
MKTWAGLLALNIVRNIPHSSKLMRGTRVFFFWRGGAYPAVEFRATGTLCEPYVGLVNMGKTALWRQGSKVQRDFIRFATRATIGAFTLNSIWKLAQVSGNALASREVEYEVRLTSLIPGLMPAWPLCPISHHPSSPRSASRMLYTGCGVKARLNGHKGKDGSMGGFAREDFSNPKVAVFCCTTTAD